MKMTEDIARQLRDRCREFISADQVADLAAKLDGRLVGEAHQRANQLCRQVAARGYVDIQIISQIALLVMWEITRRENERLKTELAEVEIRTIEMAWKVECYHIAERYASVLAEREVDSEAMAEKLHALVKERSYEDYDAFPHFDVIYSVAFCQVLHDLGVRAAWFEWMALSARVTNEIRVELAAKGLDDDTITKRSDVILRMAQHFRALAVVPPGGNA